MSEERFDRIEQRLDRLETGQHELRSGLTELRSDVTEVRSGLTEVRSRVAELDRHMHVLHEDVVARIAAIPEYTGPTKAEFAELKEMIGRRLDPLEATVRRHSIDIERLKQQRG